jgi:hypothetical protein
VTAEKLVRERSADAFVRELLYDVASIEKLADDGVHACFG